MGEIGDVLEGKRKIEHERLNKKREFLVNKVSKIPKRKTAIGEEETEYERELLEGIKDSDKDMRKITREKKWVDKPVVYGELDRPLDEYEQKAAVLYPKLAVFGKLDLKKMRREREMANAKIRYERVFNPTEEERRWRSR